MAPSSSLGKRSSDAQLEALRLATESDFEKISFERRLEWRRERYLELQNALAEFVGALDKMLAAKLRHAISVFHGDTYNEEPYLAAYGKCVEEFETVRSSGRLNERRLKIGDKQIGDLVLTLSVNADTQYVAMLRSVAEATAAFKKAGNPPGSDDRFWAEEQRNQRSDIAKRTHHISELIEKRISLSA